MIRDGIQRWLPTPGLVSCTGAEPHGVHRAHSFLRDPGVGRRLSWTWAPLLSSHFELSSCIWCTLVFSTSVFLFVPFLFLKLLGQLCILFRRGKTCDSQCFRAVGKQGPLQLRGFRESIGKIGSSCPWTRMLCPSENWVNFWIIWNCNGHSREALT